MTARLVLLDGFTTDQGDLTTWDELARLVTLAIFPRTSPEERRARLEQAEMALTNKVAITADLFEQCPRLKYVGVLATGTNVVDLAAARAHGVAVTNVPGYSTDAVAQLVFAFILHFTHRVAAHDDATKRGAWQKAGDFSFQLGPLHELAGKTLTIVGTGAIGRRVAAIAQAFGMRVLNAAVPGSTTREPRVPLDQALPVADYVTLHCPLTEATRHLVDSRFLAAMKPQAVLLNTGRGALVDEGALEEALASGHLGGAGLDVLSEEPPPPDHRLLRSDAPWAGRVVVTPHLGWASVEARARLVKEATENVRDYLAGRPRNRIV
jgi:glycerate dehydrogenase